MSATTTNGAGIQDVVISGNTICFDGSNGPAGMVSGILISSGMGAKPTNIRNVRVFGNAMDRGFALSIAAQGYWQADNVDLSGIPIHVRPVSSASGLVYHEYHEQRDGLVPVMASGASGAVLQSPRGTTGDKSRL